MKVKYKSQMKLLCPLCYWGLEVEVEVCPNCGAELTFEPSCGGGTDITGDCPQLVWDGPFVGRIFPEGVEIKTPSRATAREAETFLSREDFGRVAILVRRYNASTSAMIEGEAVVWSYSDHHGMTLAAVLRRGKTFWMKIPGHHGHGPGKMFDGSVADDGTIQFAEKPSVKKLEI